MTVRAFGLLAAVLLGLAAIIVFVSRMTAPVEEVGFGNAIRLAQADPERVECIGSRDWCRLVMGRVAEGLPRSWVGRASREVLRIHMDEARGFVNMRRTVKDGDREIGLGENSWLAPYFWQRDEIPGEAWFKTLYLLDDLMTSRTARW